MSTLREKARKVKSKGAAARRDWSPAPGSWMLRVYQWWLKETGKSISQENFCHFWRVVLVWAPLRWLKKPLLGLFALAVAAGVTWLAMLFTDTAIAILIGGLSIGYIIFGLCAAWQLMGDLDLDFEGPRWLSERSLTIRGLVYFLTLPVLIVIAIVALTFGTLAAVLRGLHEDHNLYARVWGWLVYAKLGENKWVSWLRSWLAIPLTLLALSKWYDWALPLFYWVLALAVACLLIDMGARRAAEEEARVRQAQEARRRLARESEERLRHQLVDRAIRIIFEVLHPQRQGEAIENYESRRQCWELRYADWLYREHDFEDIYAVSAYYHMDLLRRNSTYIRVLRLFRQSEEERHFEAVEQDQAPSSSKTPGRFKKFFKAIGGFFAFIWAIILTKKWGICPWVKIPVEEPEM